MNDLFGTMEEVIETFLIILGSDVVDLNDAANQALQGLLVVIPGRSSHGVMVVHLEVRVLGATAVGGVVWGERLGKCGIGKFRKRF